MTQYRNMIGDHLRMKTDKIFTNKAEFYASFRPLYSTEIFDLLQEKQILFSDCTVADIGCGTGILAKQIIPYVNKVYGIEPNKNMLQIATKTLTKDVKFEPILAHAENTTLNEESIDLISVGQAFHWFDQKLFYLECQRILKPNSYVLLMWNMKDECEMEYERRKIADRYRKQLDSYHCKWETRLAGIKEFFKDSYEFYKIPNPIVNNYWEFIGRTLSASHALEKYDKEYYRYLLDWTEYFCKYAKNGNIYVKNSTLAFIGKL